MEFVTINLVGFFIHEIVGCIEFRRFWEKRVIKKPYLNNRFDIDVIFPFGDIVKAPAEIAHGAFHPVLLVNHLHFEIDKGTVIHKHTDVKYKAFVWNMFTQHDFILNGDGLDFIHLHMKQGGNPSFENVIISL